MEDESARRGFKVEDRRRFSATGEARDTNEPESNPEPVSPLESSRPPSEAPPLPEMNFTTFVIGLLTQALVLLGEVSDPVDQQVRADLAGAKQVIDILGVLQIKTKGNLEPTEASLLENALYDLRMKFVQRSRSK